jgi:CO dehydrogenase/acetyl-CoA synthase beta subunit
MYADGISGVLDRTCSRLDLLKKLVAEWGPYNGPCLRNIDELDTNNRCVIEKLNWSNTSISYSFRYYHRTYHHLDQEDDGYFWVQDDFKDRKIYISKREVGRSRAFNEEFGIMHFIDLVNTNDEMSVDLGVRARESVYQQICRIVLQIAQSDGNVVIFCGRGRTRSPAHVAAYYIVVMCYTPDEARSMLSRQFITQRGDNRGIDRDGRFAAYLKRLELDMTS